MELYAGREQSWAKHQILRRYLEPFAYKVVQRFGTLDYIDGFSGPWESRDTESLTDTSIGISLAVLNQVGERLQHSPDDKKIRCFFNELKPSSHRMLVEFVDRKGDNFPHVEICTSLGSFEKNATAISKKADARFRLLFVDPTGYTGFSPSALAPFSGRPTEMILNLMRSFVNRFIAGDHSDRVPKLQSLVGESIARDLLRGRCSITDVENGFLRMLRETLGYKYAALSPIHNPDKNEIHFDLAYATNHPTGMDVLRTAEFNALSEHDRARAEKGKSDGGIGDLFGFEDAQGPYLKARAQHVEKCQGMIIELLDVNPDGSPFAMLAARLQEELFLTKTEIKSHVVELSENGKIEKTWLARNSRSKGPNDQDIVQLKDVKDWTTDLA